VYEETVKLLREDLAQAATPTRLSWPSSTN